MRGGRVGGVEPAQVKKESWLALLGGWGRVTWLVQPRSLCSWILVFTEAQVA